MIGANATPWALGLMLFTLTTPTLGAHGRDLSQDESFAFDVGMVSGILSTTCMMEQAGILSSTDAGLFLQGVLQSMAEKETGLRLQASREGYAVGRRKYPNCPIPEIKGLQGQRP